MYPTLATIQTKRFTELIKSYQNKTNVGTALLWALGQCGRKDLSSGLKIWSEYMRPLLRLRHYSRFVVSYLNELLHLHSSAISSGSFSRGPRILYPSQYFLIFDAIFIDGLSLPKDLQKDMVAQYPSIKKLSIGDCSFDHELFPEFLRRLEDLLLCNGATNYKIELLTCLFQCVANNPDACIFHWQQMYKANLHSSSKLLCYLDDNWKDLMKSKNFSEVKNSLILFELLGAFQDYNSSCTTQKVGLKEASESCKSLMKKLSSKLNGTNGWFPWKWCSALLLFGIISLVSMDVNRNGSFERSNTGLFLGDIGIYNQTVEYYESTAKLYVISKNWIENEFPTYYEATKQAAGPFVTALHTSLSMAGKRFWGLVERFEGKKIVVGILEKTNEYLPGLNEKLIMVSTDILKLGNDVIDWLHNVMSLALEYLMSYAQIFFNVLKEGYEALVICIQDIIDGKIELADVYIGSKKLFKKAAVAIGNVY